MRNKGVRGTMGLGENGTHIPKTTTRPPGFIIGKVLPMMSPPPASTTVLSKPLPFFLSNAPSWSGQSSNKVKSQIRDPAAYRAARRTVLVIHAALRPELDSFVDLLVATARNVYVCACRDGKLEGEDGDASSNAGYENVIPFLHGTVDHNRP